ncbi:MAG: hypothetical protein PHZ26_04735 [Candidatus Gracilibacteria bacterium]|nr:hypothetical protein [Candidatus Gracilibacteria bacterium]MDD2909034.1 hypothetical protein [Candidatus Gracilibacteria bacterium]
MTTKQNVCFMCGVNSHEKVLVKIEKEDEEKHLCVGCLPSVIHG